MPHRDILQRPYLQRTLMLMIFNFFQAIGYYGFASWVPTLLIAKGVAITSSLRYSFLIAMAAPLGPLLATRVADKFERKWQIIISAACIAAFGLLFSWETTSAWIVACGLALTCANNWMSVAFHTYQAGTFSRSLVRCAAWPMGFVYAVEPPLALFYHKLADRILPSGFRRRRRFRL